MKRFVAFSLFLFFFSIFAFSVSFETKVISDYQDYTQTFNTYLSQIEKTGAIESVPSNQVESAVYTIITEFQPAAYYRWIRMRSFQIPPGAIGNFTNVDMWYIAQNIYQRYKTNDETENVALAAFLVYAVDNLYGKSVSQTDFPYFSTFNQAVFDLGSKVQSAAADVTRSYFQKAIGGQSEILGNYKYTPLNLKDIFIAALKKVYANNIPTDILNVVNEYNLKMQPFVQNQKPSQYVSDLALQSLSQKTLDAAFTDFKNRLSQSADNAVKNVKTFLATGQSTSTAVTKALDSYVSSVAVQELLSANTVRNDVSKNFNNRIVKLEGTLASKSSVPLSPIEWRWLVYAGALVFFFIYRRKWVSYAMLAIIGFESLVLIFGIDPMLSRLDSTLYGFLIVTTAFLGFLSFFRITRVKNLFQILSMIGVALLFLLVLFVPLYSNLPSTRMSQNQNFLKSAYLGIYENELYGQNGILTYYLQNISSDISALRSDPYNFANQTVSFYLSTLKKSGALKGIVEYPNSILVNVDRNSPYFGFSNLSNLKDSISIVRDRSQSALNDITNRINAVNRNEDALSQTLDVIYTFAAPQLRDGIENGMRSQIASSNLTEISTPLIAMINTANSIKERAPNIQFFQTSDGSKLFIIISFLFLSVTFFRKNWLYRFLMSLITIFATTLIFYQKVIEIFVEYGFPTYSHVLSSGELPNIFILIVIIGVSVFVALEALYTRFKYTSTKEGKKA